MDPEKQSNIPALAIIEQSGENCTADTPLK
jgi:hypothetical protein